MTTPTLIREEASPVASERAAGPMVVDLLGLERFREARYAFRVERHHEDPDLDPRLLALWTQRDVWRTDDIRAHLGWSLGSLNKLTTMHGTDIFPTRDEDLTSYLIEGIRFQVNRLPAIDFALNRRSARATVLRAIRIVPGWESGLIMEWAYRIGRTMFDSSLGVLVPNRNVRVGRAPAVELRPKYTR